jgi:hypothetical protein
LIGGLSFLTPVQIQNGKYCPGWGPDRHPAGTIAFADGQFAVGQRDL